MGKPRRKRGEWKAWKAEHWPIFAALEADDAEPYQRALFDRIDERQQSRTRAAFCIYCHALMSVAESGEQFCPYAEDHERAKAMLAPQPAVDMLRWTKSKVAALPAPHLHCLPAVTFVISDTPRPHRKSTA